MAKRRFEAVLADGSTLTRKTEREYKYAWAIYCDGEMTSYTGFSGDRTLAERAARAAVPVNDMEAEYKRAMTRNPNWAMHIRKILAKNFGGSWETYRAEYNDLLASYRIEVVPCREV